MTEMSNLIILNLAGALSEELSSYLVKKGARVVDPSTENVVLEWTHIFVRDLDTFDAVGDTYTTLDNNTKLISLSQPRDLKNFMINNGKLVLDESWLLGPFGAFILDKFFQEFGGVNLSDSYPKFKELGSFNITNPFNTGEYLDHLVFNAFENGMSALSIKTYFDHLLMYLTSLKNKGRVGFPIEVSYGTFNDVYGLQMHFYSENMQIEDVTNSLTSSITRTPEEYLLYVSLQSSDFFDFTYLPEVNKVVITGLWTKDENIKTQNKGMMFTHSLAESPVPQQVAESSAPFVLNEGEIEDLSSLVSPAGEVEIIPADIVPEENDLQIIPAHEEEEEAVTRISGSPQDKEALTTVKGKKEEKDDFKVTLSGSKEEKPGNMTVRSLSGADSSGPGMFDFSDKDKVKDGTTGTSGSKKAAALFKVSGPSQREGDLEKKLNDALTDRDQLKSKLMSAMSELKTQKETQLRIKKVNDEAAKIVIPDGPSKLDEILRVNTSKAPPSERETRLAEEFREMEKLTRKLQLEGSQKETRFSQELEKLQRMMVLKDTVVDKTKETYTKALEKKDQEIAGMLSKLEQVNKHMVGGGAQALTTVIKELERQSQNQNKMIEMYKAKVTTLSSALESSKSDDGQKEDSRKIQLVNEQLKTQLEMAKKEVTKLQERSSSDSAQLLILKQEKAKLFEALKKAEQATRMNQTANGAAQNGEVEAKRLQAQVQLLEQYLKDSNSKVKDLEMKLQTSTAVNRNNVAAEDGQSKVKINHLENSVKKLTQDLIESRNQQAELKKDTNKLRQEKTALQNLLDKAKKDLEKFEKKPATPGKKSA